MAFSCKAVVLKDFGGPEMVEVKAVELPALQGLVEVEVHTCGVNFADLYQRRGFIPAPVPFVLGLECCGIVTAVGLECGELQVGDKVICYNHHGGMYSEVIRVAPANCFKIPSTVSFVDGAGLFVTYLTAYFSLLDIGHLRANCSVFVHSLAGGLGLAVAQICRQFDGVKVYGTVSDSKTDRIASMGLGVIAVKSACLREDFDGLCPEGLDVILETESGPDQDFLVSRLKPLGRLVVLGAKAALSGYSAPAASISPMDLILNNRVVAGFHLGLLAERQKAKVAEALRVLLEWLRLGKIKPCIDSVWNSLGDYAEAIERLEARRNVGKVILQIIK